MLHRKMFVALPLALLSQLAVDGCSASDLVNQPAAIKVVYGNMRSSHGIDGLRSDIEWARSLPPDTRLGTSNGNEGLGGKALALNLERALQSFALDTLPSPGTAAPRASSFDYHSYGDVGGASSLAPSNAFPSGMRGAKTFAYTSCNQGSMVVADVDAKTKFSNFRTGALLFTSGYPFPDGKPNYVSVSGDNGTSYPEPVGVNLSTKHTCEIESLDGFPYKMTSAFIVI